MKFTDDIKFFLDIKYRQYCRPEFIQHDPISVPKNFDCKEDIEISAFITALISWGRRPSIIAKSNQLMQLMDNQPFQFISRANPNELKQLEAFVYRTFNSSDLLFFIHALRGVYLEQGGLEFVAQQAWNTFGEMKMVVIKIRETLLRYPHLARSEKHLANPGAGSAAKRINMFLRWMVRPNNEGVDFGIWKNIPTSELLCPLDVHTARVARRLGLLQRTQNDWIAVVELTNNLKSFDAEDPVKYDFALFGLGVYEKF
ncbi:MAG: TIGR02757 family protein [Bacteroidetes bacterium]|nr:TIGR02757 family protein [Bacteroidota bacterium]